MSQKKQNGTLLSLYDKEEQNKNYIVVKVIQDSDNHVTLETGDNKLILLQDDKFESVPFEPVKMYCPYCGSVEYGMPTSVRYADCGACGCCMLFLLGFFSCLIPTLHNKREASYIYCPKCKRALVAK